MVLAGILYTLGRVLAYVALAMLLVTSVLASPSVSLWLQEQMNRFLGPLLILVGMVLVGLFDFGLSGVGLGEVLRQRIDRFGIPELDYLDCFLPSPSARFLLLCTSAA